MLTPTKSIKHARPAQSAWLLELLNLWILQVLLSADNTVFLFIFYNCSPLLKLRHFLLSTLRVTLHFIPGAGLYCSIKSVIDRS